MPIDPLAGKPAPKELLINQAKLERGQAQKRTWPIKPSRSVRHQRSSRNIT